MNTLTKIAICCGLAVGSLCLLQSTAIAEPYNMTRATPGYLYFNMPGASMARHDGELRNCATYWAGGIYPGNKTPELGMGAAGNELGSIVLDTMLSGWDRARKQINIEHCMVAKGWRLVRLDPAEGERLAGLAQPGLATALEPYVAADSPKGEVVRQWKNEEMFQSTLIASSPANASRTMLSLAAMSPDHPELPGITSVDPDIRWQSVAPRASSLDRIRPVLWSNITAPGPDQALLIYTVRYAKKKTFLFYLQREDSDLAEGADFFGMLGSRQMIIKPKGGFGQIGETELVAQPDGSFMANVAVVVPAGTWFAQGALGNMDNCLGAPAFEAPGGSAIYLGTFDSTHDRMSVSTDMTGIKDAVSGLPVTVTPAQWVNGHTYPCRQFSMYALEFDGFPFAPGYHWGSQAHSAQ